MLLIPLDRPMAAELANVLCGMLWWGDVEQLGASHPLGVHDLIGDVLHGGVVDQEALNGSAIPACS